MLYFIVIKKQPVKIKRRIDFGVEQGNRFRIFELNQVEFNDVVSSIWKFTKGLLNWITDVKTLSDLELST